MFLPRLNEPSTVATIAVEKKIFLGYVKNDDR